jgi:hypothetical protein
MYISSNSMNLGKQEKVQLLNRLSTTHLRNGMRAIDKTLTPLKKQERHDEVKQNISQRRELHKESKVYEMRLYYCGRYVPDCPLCQT